MANLGDISTTLTGKQVTTADPQKELINAMMGGAAPALAEGQFQYQLQQNQLGQFAPEVASTQAYNQAMTGYQAQNLQLSQAGLGLQQQALGQKGAQQAAQQGYEVQGYNIQQGQYPEQSAEAALAYQNAMFNARSNQAISGTTLTEGGKRDINTLQQQYGFSQQDIARAQALSQLGQKAELSGYGYSQQQLQNAQQQLALSAAANGISQQQMMTMLNYANQQAGVGAQQDVISLLSQMGQTALGNINTAGAALSNLSFGTGGPNVIAGQQVGLGQSVRP
jgi:hypothetical protein